MLAFFFLVSRGKELVRIDVEEHKYVPPHLLFLSKGAYDFDNGRWLKSDDLETATHPNTIIETPSHTFFHTLGMCWYLVSDRRFTQQFRSLCAQFCCVSSAKHFPSDSWDFHVLRQHLQNGAWAGEWIDAKQIINESDPVFNFWPL